MKKTAMTVCFFLVSVLLASFAWGYELPTDWTIKFNNVEQVFLPDINWDPAGGPVQIFTVGDGIEDNWGIAQITSIIDREGPSPTVVWSDGDNGEHLTIMFWGLEVYEITAIDEDLDGLADKFKVKLRAATETLEGFPVLDLNGDGRPDASLSIWLDNDTSGSYTPYNTSSGPGSRTSATAYPGITDGIKQGDFIFKPGIIDTDDSALTQVDQDTLTEPLTGDGTGYLDAMPGSGPFADSVNTDGFATAWGARDIFLLFNFRDHPDPGLPDSGWVVNSEDPAFGTKRVSIGDFVWEDLNANGIQDVGEPGIKDVTVNLYGCGPDGNAGTADDVLLVTTVTDDTGFYLFDNLTPANYFVEFVAPTGYFFSPQDQGADDTIDSDADPSTGLTVCFALSAGHSDRTRDAGLFGPCELQVTKTCSVAPPPGNLACEAKIAAMLLRYVGGTTIMGATVEFKGDSGATAIYTNVDLISGVTVLSDPIQNDFTIDATASGKTDLGAKTKIFINGVEEKIHTSCSTPFVAGAPAPLDKPKGDPSPNWFVESFRDKDGNTVELPPDPVPSHECTIQAPPPPHCEGKVKVLRLRYLGGDCSQTTNQQRNKAKCMDYILTTEPVRVIAKAKDGAPVWLDTGQPASVYLNDVVDIVAATGGKRELESDTNVQIFDAYDNLLQKLNIHTSCSQDLNLGDQFGSMQVVGMETTQGGTVSLGGEVEYTYSIENRGTVTVTNVTAIDDVLGIIPGSPIASLTPGASVELKTKVFVLEETINTVEVTGNAGGGTCEATDSVLVMVLPPPPRDFECDKPISEITMIWDGTQPIRVRAWKGDVGSTLLADVDNVMVGDEVTVSGYDGSPNDVTWEIFEAGTLNKIGNSKFHLSCSDQDMNGPEDCGKQEGNGKKNESKYINDWLLEGMVDKTSSFDCTP